MGAELVALRIDLVAEEQLRYKIHGLATGRALEAVAKNVRPGMTEVAVAGLLASEIYRCGAVPVTILVAADDRIRRFRHPVPTSEQVVRQRCMLVVCARRHGLIASATRMVSFAGGSDDEEEEDEMKEDLVRMNACAVIDAKAWHATISGRTLGEVFDVMSAAYKDAGFAGEERLHHQGGITAYENREVLVRPGSTQHVALGQAFAYNPSISGAKCEDTMLLTEDGPVALTATGEWPTLAVPVEGKMYQRPVTLRIKI